MLTQQTTTEMENLEASLPNLSGSLSIAPQQRFDPAYLGRGMVLSSGGLVVKRVPGVNVASFALFGNDQATGLSKYSVRIGMKSSPNPNHPAKTGHPITLHTSGALSS
jgi:hypothetical protein